MKNFFDLSEWRESVKKVAKTKNLGFKIVKKNMYFYLHVGLDQTAHQGNPHPKIREFAGKQPTSSVNYKYKSC